MDDPRFADALTDAALDRDLEAALAVDPSPEFVARVRMRVQRERDASWSPWRWAVAAAAGAIVVVVAVVAGMSRANRSPQDFTLALRGSAVPVAQDLNATQQVPVAPDSSTARPEPVEGRALGAGVSRAPQPDVPVAQPPSQGFGEPRRSSPDQSASGGGDFSPAPKRVASTRRSTPRNEPQVIFAADEARALRRLFADIQKGLIDLSSLQEGPPATAALQPPGEITFPPITFESIATATAESTEEGERQ